MNIHERLGKTIEERDHESDQHVATIRLLHRLKSGKVTLDDVVLTPNGWKMADRRPAVVPDDNGDRPTVGAERSPLVSRLPTGTLEEGD